MLQIWSKWIELLVPVLEFLFQQPWSRRFLLFFWHLSSRFFSSSPGLGGKRSAAWWTWRLWVQCLHHFLVVAYFVWHRLHIEAFIPQERWKFSVSAAMAADEYWSSEHHRVKFADKAPVLLRADPSSYHSLAMVQPGTYLDLGALRICWFYAETEVGLRGVSFMQRSEIKQFLCKIQGDKNTSLS